MSAGVFVVLSVQC